MRVLLTALTLMLLAGACATTDSAARPDDTTSNNTAASTPPPPAAAVDEAAAPEPTPPPAPEPTAAAVPPKPAPQLEEPAPEAVADPEPRLSRDASASQDFTDGVAVAAAEPARALGLFERAAKSDPGFVLAWHNAGASAERQGKLTDAIAYYQKALERRPDYFPSLYSLIQIYTRQGKAADARSLAERAVTKKRSASSLAAASAAALAARQVGEAERQAKAALKLDEKFVPAMLLLAEAFHAQGKFELAKFVLSNAKEVDPRNALVHQALGRALLALKNPQGAQRSFEEAIAIRQDLVESYNNLAVLYYESGDYGAALTSSKNAVDQAPQQGAAWLNYGNALRAAKRHAEAIQAYEKTISLSDAEAATAAQFNLGILYIDNPVDKLDDVQRMDKAMGYLNAYKGRARLDEAMAEKLDKYLAEADREKQRELKRRERDAKRAAKDAAKKKAEEEARIKAEEEAKQKAAEEAALLKAQEDARKKAEQEALKKAEADAARQKAEAEAARLKAEEEARKKAEEAARLQAEEEARKKAEEEAKQRKLGGGGK
ncbi:MAG: tetratricopeptide repeat protein [Pseudomonadota bacterium]